MAADGINYSGDNRVENFNERKLHGKVVDNILNAPTFYSRQVGMGSEFEGKTMDFTVDVVSDTQGQFFTGLEDLNATAVQTTIPLSYSQTAFTQPKVGIMLESFVNTGSSATINLDVFKLEKAKAQALQALGSAIYGDGSANKPDGLGIIVDDAGTIGGQSRATYSQLNATDTASVGTLTLAKLATLYSAVTAASIEYSQPNIGVTTKAVFDLYESLLTPTVRAEYQAIGFDKLSTRAMSVTKSGSQNAAGAAGFDSLQYRGMPIIRDDFATSGYLYFLNEESFGWFGRTIVPEEYKPYVEKVNLGTQKAYEGVGAESLDLPSEYNGWFYQKAMVLPNQAGTIGRFYVIGQEMTWEPRRNGRLTGITGV